MDNRRTDTAPEAHLAIAPVLRSRLDPLRTAWWLILLPRPTNRFRGL